MKWTLLLAVVIVGCSRASSDGPPQVHYGRDECAHCGMILSDERCAAALLVDGNSSDSPQALLFDDIGDMIEYEKAHLGLKVKREFVHDFETRGWLESTKATYVMTDKIQTPMGSGIIAFTDATRAGAKATEVNGKVSDRSGLAALLSPTTRP